MPKLKLTLLHRDAFLCTVMTFMIAGIIYGIFINLSVLDPFEKAFKDFNFTDIFYSKQFKSAQRNDDIIIVNIKHADRFQIARAIDKVGNQNPKAMGLDIIFKERKQPFFDSILKNTISAQDMLITSYYRDKDSVVRNDPYFKGKSEKEGYINLNLHGQNTVIRDFIGLKQDNERAFATQLAMEAGYIDHSFAQKKLIHRLPINYIGNESAFLTFDIEEVINSESIPAIKNAIVLFGYLGDGNNEFDIEDKHFTPMNEAWVGRAVPDTYGVVIHANVLNMLTQSSFIKRLPRFIVYLMAFAICFFVIMIVMRIYKKSNLAYDITIKVIQLVISVILLYAAFVLLKMRVYINTAPILIISVLGIEMIEYYGYLVEYLNKKFKWKSYLLDSL
ncbi:MAG: CHASE2 domain-containing protein [Bacteroidia bacterium]|nr:CHASE2 domain-containing protein [Bacteroidia bacterium]NNF83133.1 CHASE2 domain-containing protein [Flavobacteriaceae bacterium]NNK71128.1 CHASE2 domain-containing protein [Flavobacteriaceae bacterium]